MGTLGFQRLKVVALAANDMSRARQFYGETLALPPAHEGSRQVGYMLGNIILLRLP
jgi:catechol-2,3-dioxygenase